MAAMSVANAMFRSSKEEITVMLKYIETVKRLSTDKDGVVSLEYVIVAACVCAVVIAVYGNGAGGALGGAINTGFTAIGTAMAGL